VSGFSILISVIGTIPQLGRTNITFRESRSNKTSNYRHQSFNLHVHDTANCAYRKGFLEVLLSPCKDLHVRNMSAFNAVPLEGLQ